METRESNIAADTARFDVAVRAGDIDVAAHGAGRHGDVGRDRDLEIHADVIPIMVAAVHVDAAIIAVGVSVLLHDAHDDAMRRLLPVLAKLERYERRAAARRDRAVRALVDRTKDRYNV